MYLFIYPTIRYMNWCWRPSTETIRWGYLLSHSGAPPTNLIRRQMFCMTDGGGVYWRVSVSVASVISNHFLYSPETSVLGHGVDQWFARQMVVRVSNQDRWWCVSLWHLSSAIIFYTLPKLLLADSWLATCWLFIITRYI